MSAADLPPVGARVAVAYTDTADLIDRILSGEVQWVTFRRRGSTTPHARRTPPSAPPTSLDEE